MNPKEIELIKNECAHLNNHLKAILNQLENELDDPKRWYDIVSDFLLTKNLLNNVNKKMTDSLGELLLKPTSLDVVDADGFSELFRIRVDQNIEKEREELIKKEKDNWLNEGVSTEQELIDLKNRIINQQNTIEYSAQLIIEEVERKKKRGNFRGETEIVKYEIKNDELVHQLLTYNGAVSVGQGLVSYVPIVEKVVKKPIVPAPISRVTKSKKDDEEEQSRLFKNSQQKYLASRSNQQAIKNEPYQEQQQQQQQQPTKRKREG